MNTGQTGFWKRCKVTSETSSAGCVPTANTHVDFGASVKDNVYVVTRTDFTLVAQTASLHLCLEQSYGINKDTDVAPEVVTQASPHQVVGLLLLPQTVQGQALHCQGLWNEPQIHHELKPRGRKCFPLECLPPCSANLGFDRICLQNLSPFLYCLCS